MNLPRIFIFGLIASVFFYFTGCNASKGTSTGNPLVSLRFGSYNASLSAGTGLNTNALSETRFCFKRLRLKQSASSGDDNIDFALGDVAISSSGTNLGTVMVPPGIYTRVEIDLDNSCGTGYSVSLTNSNGSFSTNDGMTIRFDGAFTQTQSNTTLELQLQQIVTALNTVTSNSQIRAKAEGASGGF